MDEVDDGIDHFGGGAFADFGAIGAGVEIEMDAEEAFGAGEAFGGSVGGAGDDGCGERGCGE